MTWLLGAVSAIGAGGVVALAIFIARQANNNRADLVKLIDATKTIGERDRDQAVRIERYNQLEAANSKLKDDLARANEAAKTAQELLLDRPDVDPVNNINRALSVLSKMSSTEAATASEDDHR